MIGQEFLKALNAIKVSEDIYARSIHDKYACRLGSLSNICLADFVAKYTIRNNTKSICM